MEYGVILHERVLKDTRTRLLPTSTSSVEEVLLRAKKLCYNSSNEKEAKRLYFCWKLRESLLDTRERITPLLRRLRPLSGQVPMASRFWKELQRRLERQDPQQTARWAGIVASTWVSSTLGIGYSFGLYSPMLKQFLGYSQAQLNTLAFATDVGGNVGIMAGMAVDVFPVWGLLLIGSLESLLGHGAIWMVLRGFVGPFSFWQICVLLALGSNYSTWLDTACMVTSIRNYPHKRGTVSGILKCCYGLSSAMFTLLYTAIFFNDATSFLLLVALAPLLVSLLALFFVRPIPPAEFKEDLKEKPSFVLYYILLIIFTLYLLAASLFSGLSSVKAVYTQILAAGMILFLGAPLCIPVIFSGGNPQSSEIHEPFLITVEATNYGTFSNSKSNGNGTNTLDTKENDATVPLAQEGFVSEEEGVNLMQAMKKADFWLLFFSFLCGMGTAMTANNNLGQLGEAQGYKTVGIFVSLISIFSSFGRLAGGAASDYYLRLAAIPRPVWLGCAQGGLLLAHLLFATALPGSLYPASILLGFSFGVHWSIIIPIISDLFGLKNMGMLYNTISIAIAFGTLIFSGFITGPLYDWEAKKQMGLFVGRGHQNLEMATCTGVQCFRLAFIIMAGVCLVGILINLVLVARSGNLYQSLSCGESLRETNLDCEKPPQVPIIPVQA